MGRRNKVHTWRKSKKKRRKKSIKKKKKKREKTPVKTGTSLSGRKEVHTRRKQQKRDTRNDRNIVVGNMSISVVRNAELK